SSASAAGSPSKRPSSPSKAAPCSWGWHCREEGTGREEKKSGPHPRPRSQAGGEGLPYNLRTADSSPSTNSLSRKSSNLGMWRPGALVDHACSGAGCVLVNRVGAVFHGDLA